jgi:Rrf2 family protein
MRLTRASVYALEALVYMASEGEGRRVPARLIVRGRGISGPFLGKVLEPLVAAGVLLADRGRGGGYRLAKPAAKITLLEVVEAVEGPIRGEVPPAGGGGGRVDAQLQAACGRAAHLTRRRLAGVRLPDLAGGGT